MAKKLTLQEVKNRIADINPNIEILSDKYNGASSRGLFKCKVCNHKWDTLFMNTLKGIGCPKCARVIQPSFDCGNLIYTESK